MNKEINKREARNDTGSSSLPSFETAPATSWWKRAISAGAYLERNLRRRRHKYLGLKRGKKYIYIFFFSSFCHIRGNVIDGVEEGSAVKPPSLSSPTYLRPGGAASFFFFRSGQAGVSQNLAAKPEQVGLSPLWLLQQ